MQLGVDTGGTFTDVVTNDGDVLKVTSTPGEPDRAVRDAVRRVATTRPALLAHGTTVATNALLEGRGGQVALVATRGFADVIEIARQTRPSLYDPYVDRPAPLGPRQLRFEVGGRLDGAGHELERLDPDRVPVLPDGVDAVAVSLLHADLDATHERAVAACSQHRGPVSSPHLTLPTNR